MIASTITSKGQITIPKEIRDKFHLKTHDRLLFKPEGNRIIIKPVAGTILDIKGTFPVKAKISFEKLRVKMEKEIAGKTIKEMS
ncbi:MAG: AbrB/MazE/SpoVT family DNA-binding domain-containing protein [Candidatus Omnitrophota bacterium]|nr:AbrB/MazE/SpoVT family DNA-binding domain-containing protein [Candidatus Omnitrophota bacterium]